MGCHGLTLSACFNMVTDRILAGRSSVIGAQERNSETEVPRNFSLRFVFSPNNNVVCSV